MILKGLYIKKNDRLYIFFAEKVVILNSLINFATRKPF